MSRVVFAPESTTRLLVSSWDKNVYLYEIEDGDAGSAKLVRQFEHRAPVMDVCFGGSDNEAFTAGVDHRVTRLASNNSPASRSWSLTMITTGSILKQAPKPS